MTNPHENQPPFDPSQGFQQPYSPAAGQPTAYPPVPQPGQPPQPYPGQPYAQVPPGVEQKSKVLGGLLGLFLGGLGIHNFYLGYTGRGIAQLVLWLVSAATTFILIGFIGLLAVGIWAFVESIMIFMGAGPYDRDARGVPLK